jgi:hypothetical protein
MAKARTRKQQHARAKYLRVKVRDGKDLSDEETSWLNAYDVEIAQRASSAAPAEPAEGAAPEETETSDEVTDETTPIEKPPMAPKPPPPPRVPLPPAGALPPPPKTSAKTPDAERAEGEGPWQAKYRRGAGGVGRETTVTQLADQWVNVLKLMAAQTKMAGVDPIIDPESLRNAIVLTLDNVLPDKVKVTPEMMAVGGSTAIVAQRFFRRKEIAEAIAVAEARHAHDEFRRKQGGRADEPAPEPPAPSEPVAPKNQEQQELPLESLGQRDAKPTNPVAPVNGSSKPAASDVYMGGGVL